jgi:hypothetical protein
MGGDPPRAALSIIEAQRGKHPEYVLRFAATR